LSSQMCHFGSPTGTNADRTSGPPDAQSALVHSAPTSV